MAKYRERAVVVEAEQWFPGKVVEGVEEVPATPSTETTDTSCWLAYGLMRTGSGGREKVHPGDWIVVDRNQGTRHVLAPAVFARRYEPLES